MPPSAQRFDSEDFFYRTILSCLEAENYVEFNFTIVYIVYIDVNFQNFTTSPNSSDK